MKTLNVPVVLAALAIAACADSSETRETQPAQLGGFAYDAPSGWAHVDTHGPSSVTSTWAPDLASNERKESLVVIRTEINPALAKAGMPVLQKSLREAQGELPQLHATTATLFTSDRGLPGARLEVDFMPAGRNRPYHRVHAVVLDGTSLIHVMYTAVRPDYDERALNRVLASLRRGEG